MEKRYEPQYSRTCGCVDAFEMLLDFAEDGRNAFCDSLKNNYMKASLIASFLFFPSFRCSSVLPKKIIIKKKKLKGKKDVRGNQPSTLSVILSKQLMKSHT